MLRKTFQGGVHPADGKEFARNIPYRVYLPKGDLVFPLNQHIGKPARPVVQKGDLVLTGQLLAEADGFVSANIVSSCSGKVKAVENRKTVAGPSVPCIVVENDGNYTLAEGIGTENDATNLTSQEILEKIKAAGIIGLGGAGFPTHVKLAPKNPQEIEYVIANGAECEPYITCDDQLMRTKGSEIVEGLKIMLRLFPNAEGVILIEENKPEAIKAMEQACAGQEKIHVWAVHTKYPQGGERSVISVIAGKHLKLGMLPADAGCVVDNVDTIVAVYHAVAEGKPLMNRIVTVTGDAVNDPRNFYVRIGMNYHDLIEEAGSFKTEPEKVVSGGPMMGFALFDLNVPTTKTASALLCLTKDEVSALAPSPCINCGRCVDACPGRIVPRKLAVLAEHGDEEAFLANDGMECCECGCCSFICPAKRQLTQSIKSMRKTVLANRKK